MTVHIMRSMNSLPIAARAQMLSMLCEVVSMRSVSRLTDTSINTVSKLLVDAGRFCAGFHDVKVRAALRRSAFRWRSRRRMRAVVHERRGADRLSNRVQLTSDGHKAYLEPSKVRSAAMWTTQSSERLTGPRRTPSRAATAPPSASASRRTDRRQPRPGARQHVLRRRAG